MKEILGRDVSGNLCRLIMRAVKEGKKSHEMMRASRDSKFPGFHEKKGKITRDFGKTPGKLKTGENRDKKTGKTSITKPGASTKNPGNQKNPGG